MKHVVLLLLLVACAPKDSSDSLVRRGSRTQEALWADLSARYQPEVDVMVAFLWPAEVNDAETRGAVRTTIALARRLAPLKREYLLVKRGLDERFAALDCNCALNGLCEEGDDDTQLEACLEVEERLSENARLLSQFYDVVDEMKRTIRGCGGEWIATNLDYPLLPPSRLDLAKLDFTLNAFGERDDAGETRALSYLVAPPRITTTPTALELTWSFPDQLEGLWSFEVGAFERDDESLVFQGTLFFTKGATRRRGIVQWEHLRSRATSR